MTEQPRRRPWAVGLRTSPEDHRVTTFELFFDLVYVFAFTQVSRLIVETHSGSRVVVYEQNRERTTKDELWARGDQVHLTWSPDHTFVVDASGAPAAEEAVA